MGVKKQGPFDESQAQPCVIYARYSSHAQRDASIEQQVASMPTVRNTPRGTASVW